MAAALLLVSCGGDGDTGPDLRGQNLEVLAVWESVEQERFERVLALFELRTGVAVTYTSTAGEDTGAVIDDRLAEGRPPDIAILPQPGLLERYVREGVVRPAGEAVAQEVDDHFAAVWRDLASVDGQLYGVWFKAANKSLVWYRIGAFERAGVVPPDDLDGLLAVARALAPTGPAAFAIGGDDAWVLTDWFENVYLRLAGPDRYDDLAERRIPWTHPTVVEALELLAELFGPELVAGGPAGARATTFRQSVAQVFGASPVAAMVVEGDFVAGEVTATTESEIGLDADAFPFPEVRASGRMVVGGGDVAVLLRDRPVAQALLRFLATPEAATVWARQGGFLSANEDVDLRAYPDPLTRSFARALLEAGDDFRFDLSDLQPAELGATSGAGMFLVLQEFLADRDAARAAVRLEAAAVAAFGEG